MPDLARPRHGVQRLTVEQFELASHRVAGIFGVHRMGIGCIDPDQILFRPARPNRLRRQIQQRAQIFELRRLPRLVFAQPHQFEPIARHVAHAQNHLAADGAALRLQMAAAEADQILVKTLATLAQQGDMGRERLGLIGGQPGVEIQHPGRRRRSRRQGRVDQAHVALDLGFAPRAAPHHDELRLGGEKGARPLGLLAQIFGFGQQLRLAP